MLFSETLFLHDILSILLLMVVLILGVEAHEEVSRQVRHPIGGDPSV